MRVRMKRERGPRNVGKDIEKQRDVKLQGRTENDMK
jgi:hypothetical protein